MVVAGQQRVQRDGMAVNVVDLNTPRPGRGGDAGAGGPPGMAKPGASAPVAAASAPVVAASAMATPVMPAAPASSAASGKGPSAGGKSAAPEAKGPNPCDEMTAGDKPQGKPTRKPA